MEQLFSDGKPQGLLQKDSPPNATFPNGFEVSFSHKNFPCFLAIFDQKFMRKLY